MKDPHVCVGGGRTCSHVCVCVCVCGSVRKNKCQTEGGLPPPPPSMSLTMGRLDSWMSQEQSSQLVGRLASCPGARSGRGQRNVSLHCQMPPIPRPVLTCSYWSCLPGPGLTGDQPRCPGRLISGTGPRRAAGRRRNYVCTTPSAQVLGLTVRQSLSQESPSGA